MPKPATIALTLLTTLIILSPLAWWIGVPWHEVLTTASIWCILWLLVAYSGRDRQ